MFHGVLRTASSCGPFLDQAYLRGRQAQPMEPTLLNGHSNRGRSGLVAKWLRALQWSVLTTIGVSGCAITRVDATGVLHVTGFVSMAVQMHREGDAKDLVEAVRVNSVGVSLLRSDITSALTVGYGSNLLISLPPNSCAEIAR